MQREKYDRQGAFPTNEHGFTFVELLTTLVISVVILASLYSAYLTQQRSQVTQDQLVEMQQNIRAALGIMTSEIRMAGFDPQGTSGAGIVSATKNKVQFTFDRNENGSAADPNENITYGFALAYDADGDGLADAGAAPLGRTTGGGGGAQSIAENIQAVEFVYLVGDAMKPTVAPAVSDLGSIRAVTISILARAKNADQNFTNSATYVPASVTEYSLPTASWGPFGDHFRRRLYISTVTIRNVGL